MAGIEVRNDARIGWIRPSKGWPNEGFLPSEACYREGSELRVGDLVVRSFLEHSPRGHHVENWLVHRSSPFTFVERWTYDKIERLVDPPARLWIVGVSSTEGENDRIPISSVADLKDSLRLVKVSRFALSVMESFNRRQLRGAFEHCGKDYRLSVTDAAYERDWLEKPIRNYELGECLLTISLTHRPFDGYFYKVIAGILPKVRVQP